MVTLFLHIGNLSIVIFLSKYSTLPLVALKSKNDTPFFEYI
ncbi:hypothetical protein J6TS2_17400 [Heyndrickxia sporothermodurans]|nr:hypothetical protein J6TS2_17400 [Heyndrickxia sporothermodurans]